MWRTDSFEKTLMLGKIEGRRRRGQQRMRWLDGITNSMGMSEWTLGAGDGQGGLACCDSWGRKESDMTEQLNCTDNIQPWYTPFPIWNQSFVPCLVLTVAPWPAYRFLRKQVRWSVIPSSWRIFHTVKGFSIDDEAEVDVSLVFSCFFSDPVYVGSLISGFMLSHSVVSDSLWPLGPATCQAPPSIRFSRQEYWSGWPFPPPGDHSDSGIEPESAVSPALQADSLPTEPSGKSQVPDLVELLVCNIAGSLFLFKEFVPHEVLPVKQIFFKKSRFL